MKKKIYNAPQMELHALKVERGFAATGDYGLFYGSQNAAGSSFNSDGSDGYNDLGSF